MLRTFFGNEQHLWMWDYNSMKLELDKVGFINIRMAHFNDSEDPMFAAVEEQERFSGALAIQCQKPI